MVEKLRSPRIKDIIGLANQKSTPVSLRYAISTNRAKDLYMGQLRRSVSPQPNFD